MTSINFSKMIQHIKMYAGKDCRNPDELQGEDKERSLEIYRSGEEAIGNLNKLADYFEKYGLKNKNNSRWLYASGKKVREKIWNQLKNEEHEEFPTSVTLLIQEREQVELCIVLDYYARNPKLTVLQQHHQFLDMDLRTDSHFFYRVTPKNSRDKIISNESLDEVKKKLLADEYELVELMYILKEEEISAGSWSDLEILKVLDTAFSKVMKAYNSIISNTITVEEVASTLLDKKVKPVSRTQLYREKNMILHGPPGTGKTYHTILYAVSIIEGKTINELIDESYSEVKKRFDSYKAQNQIAFTTFHQSYGYEEFIEGIKPTVDEDGQIKYAIEQGVFKEFCELAGKTQLVQDGAETEIKENAAVWKVSLGRSGNNVLKSDCFEKQRIRIGWDDFGQDPFIRNQIPNSAVLSTLQDFYENMKIGDIVFSLKDSTHIDAIGIITGDASWLSEEANYKRSRNVKWLVTDISEDIFELNHQTNLTQKTIYRLNRISTHQVVHLLQSMVTEGETKLQVNLNEKPHVFIIDEINRGNISKILGELITLLETSKRLGEKEELTVTLPYSKKEFGVPKNVYVVGTMNTADRSIALMDTALRRRFQFIEQLPDENKLENCTIGKINLKNMLKVMNQRIEVLYDREHTIGHAYFMDLQDNTSIDQLKRIFENKIIPLLQEYFYEDFGKIQLILNDLVKDKKHQIIQKQSLPHGLFAKNDLDFSDEHYQINLKALDHEESYIQIYGSTND
ncbi:AAA family ATPase [Exiguobacterium undae]|uniref:AAA family ATPase n=1 Tax=Exiguobacterium undae TaxID=169177 RepID=UPI000688DE5D|nr:AAA family ATPase [Exiguobacterium undae]